MNNLTLTTFHLRVFETNLLPKLDLRIQKCALLLLSLVVNSRHIFNVATSEMVSSKIRKLYFAYSLSVSRLFHCTILRNRFH